MQKYGVEQYGITLVKPTSNFASKNKRFEHQNEQRQMISEEMPITDKQPVPGPGAYHKDLKWATS